MYLHFFHGGFTGWSPPSPSPPLWKFQFTAPACKFRLNRGEKSLSHFVMVAKLLDDNKPRKSLKKYMRTVSNFIDLIQFHLICQMLAKFSGYFESERTISKFRKRKIRFCVVFTYSIKQVREIRKVYVTVVQWQLRNAQKCMICSCCFAKAPYCKLWSRNFAATW